MTESRDARQPVVVVGAGIVGLCCAIALRREGFAVTLLDWGAPGEGCSGGNSANLGVGRFPTPGLWKKVPRLLLDPEGPLKVEWWRFPSLLPWFWRHLRCGAPTRSEPIADALISLIGKAVDAYAPLVAEAGISHLIERRGALFVYESAESLARDRRQLEMRRRRGTVIEELGGDAVREREPAVGPRVACGVFLPEAGHMVDPRQLIDALVRHFAARGGVLSRATVRDVVFAADGSPTVVADDGHHAAHAVVIAAGAWSRDLARRLGTRLPMAVERGYSVTLPNPGVAIRTPIRMHERNLVVTPMAGGLRIVGIAEFGVIDSPPRFGHVATMIRQAQALLPGLDGAGGTPWMGPRPSMPDGLPVIGRSPRHPALFFACGHGHTGMSGAPMTGRLIAQLVARRRTEIDVAPFRPDRF